MTDEEKRARRAERDAAICAHYAAGNKAAQCASKFRISRQRVLQILRDGNVWKPYEKGDRTEFLGVSLSADDKLALSEEASRRGISMSSLTSDLIKDMLTSTRQEAS